MKSTYDIRVRREEYRQRAANFSQKAGKARFGSVAKKEAECEATVFAFMGWTLSWVLDELPGEAPASEPELLDDFWRQALDDLDL